MQNLDDFTRAYIECAIWCECNPDNDELSDKSEDDLAPETLGAMIADCQRFQVQHSALLKSAYAMQHNSSRDGLLDYTPSSAGHDFWLSRNGHGAGFFDRGLGDIGEALSNACGFRTNYDTVTLYAGDDGKIYAQ